VNRRAECISYYNNISSTDSNLSICYVLTCCVSVIRPAIIVTPTAHIYWAVYIILIYHNILYLLQQPQQAIGDLSITQALGMAREQFLRTISSTTASRGDGY
jgi:hypothetical protein